MTSFRDRGSKLGLLDNARYSNAHCFPRRRHSFASPPAAPPLVAAVMAIRGLIQCVASFRMFGSSFSYTALLFTCLLFARMFSCFACLYVFNIESLCLCKCFFAFFARCHVPCMHSCTTHVCYAHCFNTHMVILLCLYYLHVCCLHACSRSIACLLSCSLYALK